MGEVALRFLQAGIENPKGTAVDATRLLMARITNPSFDRPRDFVEEDTGSLVGARRFIDGVKDYGFTIEQEGATFEDLPFLFGAAVIGSVAPTTINTAAYRRVYTPQTTATGDSLDAMTVEFGDDSQEFECEYCEATSFTLGFDTLQAGQAAPVRASFDFVTQSLASNTKTAGLTAPTVDTILATNATIALGTTATAYGSLTPLTGSLRSFTLTYENNLAKKVYVGDGDTYSNMGRGRRVVTFDAMVEGDSSGVSRFVDWDLGTEKRLRLTFQGPVITGSNPARTKLLQIDGRFVLTTFNPLEAVDTNTVFALGGRFLPDTALTTSGAEIEFTVINGVASY